MLFEPEDIASVKPITDDMAAGKITIMEAARAVERKLPGSAISTTFTSMGAFDELENGSITLGEAERIIFEQADLHPALPDTFLLCDLVSARGDREGDRSGYLALASEKNKLPFGTEQLEKILKKGGAPAIREMLGASPRMVSTRIYLESGAPHLVKHMLVQAVVTAGESLDEELMKEILDRAGEVGPVLSNMARDLLGFEAEQPPSWVLMARLLGVLRPLEAVEAMVEGLEMLFFEDLHETVLTLVKLAEDYPALLSGLMKDIVADPDQGEATLNAIEVLGWRWREQGNLEFLYDTLRTLDPDDEDFDHLFRFLTQSLMRTGLGEAAEAVEAALDEFRVSLERTTIEGTDALLEVFEPFEDTRVEGILREDPYDLCSVGLDPMASLDRVTITLLHETAYSAELYELASDLEEEETAEFPAEWSRVGRNEPCPCGSGKKFKKCCLPGVEGQGTSGAYSWAEEDEGPLTRLTDRTMAFAQSSPGEGGLKRAVQEFLRRTRIGSFEEQETSGSPVDLASVFIDWFLFGRRDRRGRTVADRFAESKPSLPADEEEMLAAGQAGSFSVFEALEVRLEEGITLRDLFRGDVLEVSEKLATRTLARWDLLGVRIGPVGDHNELLGGVFPVPLESMADIVRYGKRKAREAINAGEVSSMDEFLEREGYLLAAWSHRKCLEIMRRPMPTIVTPEGDLMCCCEALYQVDDPDAVLSILDEGGLMEGIEKDKSEEYAGNDVFKEMSAVRPGEVGFGWEMSPPMERDLRAGEHIGPFLPRIAEMREQTGEAGQSEASGMERGPAAGAAEQPEFEAGEFKRIFGTLNLTGDRLSFKAWSRERLEYGKDALERYLAPHVQHLLDKIEDQVPLMEMAYERAWEEPDEGEGETLPSGIDPEVAGRLEEEHLERHYSTWPDVPLPALDGKTPPRGRPQQDRSPQDQRTAEGIRE